MASLSQRSCQTGCGILGRLILSVRSVLELLVIRSLVKVIYWSQALPCIPTWDAVHLLVDYYWGLKLDSQRCDDTLSWATLVLGSNSLLGRLCIPCQINYSWYCLRFAVRKATGSSLLWIFILIWYAVSAFLLDLSGLWSSFQIFSSGSGNWLHIRILFVRVILLNWCMRWRKYFLLSAW